MPFLSVVSGCYNEVENVEDLYRQVVSVIDSLPPRDGEPYTDQYIFIDNASSDGTVDVLRKLCAEDSRVKVIVNTRNFGHVRSPYYALLQARGEAVIGLASDLQDPPRRPGSSRSGRPATRSSSG